MIYNIKNDIKINIENGIENNIDNNTNINNDLIFTQNTKQHGGRFSLGKIYRNTDETNKLSYKKTSELHKKDAIKLNSKIDNPKYRIYYKDNGNIKIFYIVKMMSLFGDVRIEEYSYIAYIDITQVLTFGQNEYTMYGMNIYKKKRPRNRSNRDPIDDVIDDKLFGENVISDLTSYSLMEKLNILKKILDSLTKEYNVVESLTNEKYNVNALLLLSNNLINNINMLQLAKRYKRKKDSLLLMNKKINSIFSSHSKLSNNMYQLYKLLCDLPDEFNFNGETYIKFDKENESSDEQKVKKENNSMCCIQ